ncbi:LxmA leader domain family RiPP [Glutamicibacter sp. 363]|uniref:LxmA leader domain family RiPP n=1 Tax=Micrococcaceae TaxID=1268 RepID=UPI0015E2916B|nr:MULTISPECIES: LxmA leader domain family RiPP [unclassified Arthrobacter]
MDNNALAPQANLTDLAQAHNTFTTAGELGADAATEAPATSPLCVGIIIGATLGAGC